MFRELHCYQTKNVSGLKLREDDLIPEFRESFQSRKLPCITRIIRYLIVLTPINFEHNTLSSIYEQYLKNNCVNWHEKNRAHVRIKFHHIFEFKA